MFTRVDCGNYVLVAKICIKRSPFWVQSLKVGKWIIRSSLTSPRKTLVPLAINSLGSSRIHPKASNMTEVVRHLNGFKLLLLITTWTVIAGVSVKAVDIQGFSSSSACSGSGYTFPGIAQRVCTSMSVGSILIRDLSSCQTGRVYRNGGCTTQVGNGNGPNVRCFVGGSYTGADWFNGCRRRRLQGAETSGSPCTEKAVPNGVHYTESLSKGSWILKTPNATDVMNQLMGVDDAEKASWLEALGAYHVAGTDTIELVV